MTTISLEYFPLRHLIGKSAMKQNWRCLSKKACSTQKKNSLIGSLTMDLLQRNLGKSIRFFDKEIRWVLRLADELCSWISLEVRLRLFILMELNRKNGNSSLDKIFFSKNPWFLENHRLLDTPGRIFVSIVFYFFEEIGPTHPFDRFDFI